MREKLVSKTYLRDVSSYEVKFFNLEEQDFYVLTKKIIKVKESFVISSGITLIDDGYTMVEITPKNENYNVRAYLDKENNLLQYYIDISLKNGFDASAMIPYYTDLYLDIIITKGEVEVVDEDELEAALSEQKITDEDFKLAEAVKEKLLKEIENGTNKYLNLNLEKYIK